MKLNHDCIRDILFSIEDLSEPNSLITSEQLSQTIFLNKYPYEDVLYHLQQLIWDNYIMVPTKYKDLEGSFVIKDLSPKGHEFISNIRKDTNWNKVKSISKDVGCETLSSIKTIAENVISTAITKSMGIS